LGSLGALQLSNIWLDLGCIERHECPGAPAVCHDSIMRQPISECVFCGNTPTTDEHVLGKWLRKHFPIPVVKGPKQKRTIKRFGLDSTNPRWTEEGKGNKRPSHTTKVKVVCGPCNDGWMSALEVAFQPILLRMLTERSIYLEQEDLFVLRRWAQKTALMFEYDDVPSIVQTAQMRADLYAGSDVEGVRVYVARREVLGEPVRLAHHGGTVRIQGGERTTSPNFGFTSIALGTLVFFVTIEKPGPPRKFRESLVLAFPELFPISEKLRGTEWPKPEMLSGTHYDKLLGPLPAFALRP
jgi:hypothetical protein